MATPALIGVNVTMDGKTTEEASKLVQAFGLPGLVSSVLGVAQDYVDSWRSRNLVRWFDRFERQRGQRTAEGKPQIPLSLLMPALRAVAEEDDDDMLDLWARLVAGFEDAAKATEPRKVFIRLLSEMRPIDARLLIFLFGEEAQDVIASRPKAPPLEPDVLQVNNIIRDQGPSYVMLHEAVASLGVTEAIIVLSAANVTRLGWFLAETSGTTIGTPLRDPIAPTLVTANAHYFSTELARALVDALPPSASPPIISGETG